MTFIEDLALTEVIFTRYILVICLILGIIGSLFNLIIFGQKKLRSNSCSVYFIATSIFNLLVILCDITPILLISYLPNEPALNSSIFCKTRSYITHSFLMMSRSSVALACIDRFALCSRNVHIRRLNQRHIAIILVIIISILWLIIPIHMIVYNNIQIPDGRCGASGIYLIIFSAYIAIVTSIPLAIMIIFSFWAIQSLQYTRTRVHPNTPRRIAKRDVQLMTILISEVVVYFLSTVWFPIYTIYLAITVNTSKTTSRLAIEGFMRYLILSFLVFLNSCSIFYVHLLASKVFRQECKQFILNLFKYDQNNRVLPRTSEASNIRNELNNIYDRQQIAGIPNNN
jgi:hypothetical protein